MSAEKRERAEAVRMKGMAHLDGKGMLVEEGVGDGKQGYTDMDLEQRDGLLRCLRCTGLGYLSCMACSD